MSNYRLVWGMLKELFQKQPELQAGPAKNAEIQKAEKEICLNFSNEYKKFLLLYGGALLPGHDIYGLKRQRSMASNWSVVQNTHFYKEKQKWPGIEDWYIVSDDGSGNPIGIDPEGRVWLSDHDAGFEKIKLANSFEEFLYRLYTDTLYEDPDQSDEVRR